MPDAVAERGPSSTAAAARGGSASRPGQAFERLGAVADAVLYEGYLLYPYRRSSAKNRVRWQFGVLLPRDWVERDGPVPAGVSGSADSWYQQTECVLRVPGPDAVVRVKVRGLQMQHKQVEEAGPDGRHHAVESLRAPDGTEHLTFDEAVPCEAEITVSLGDLTGAGRTFPVGAAADERTETLPGAAGRVVRGRAEVHAATTLTAERLAPDLVRLRVRTENTGRAADPGATRERALREALIATHTLIGGEGLEFASAIDPPAGLAEHVRACRNEFTFPVLGGDPPGPEEARHGDGTTGEVLLSSPIILPDHPQIAPESPGDLHDAAEIDEILTLRTMLLTDEEKREARATDPRAARILDRVDNMPDEVFARLHGAIRSLSPAGRVPRTAPDPQVTAVVPEATAAVVEAGPEAAERPAWWREGADDGLSPSTDTVVVDGVRVGGGSRVRLRPRGRGADVQDMFLEGRTAEVAAVFHDVDGSVHVAVTLEDDPAAELHFWYGRFHYFRPDELEPLPDSTGPVRTEPSDTHSEGQQP
ncbi:hypothetical protein ACF1B0_35060, partial [Streptomyces anandii]|uniref:hypothetical protein n=1 Tax=Streptomyces anandii TaxID=285454 RepID=UPI0037014F45